MKKIGVNIIRKIGIKARNGMSIRSEEKHGGPVMKKSDKRANKKPKAFHFKWHLRSSTTIRSKLITSFMVPVAFIILLGFVSFKVASNSIVKNYEKSAKQSINMTGEYLRFGLDSVEASSIQYGNDETIKKYFSNLYANDKRGFNSAFQYIGSILSAKQVSDEFIENIHLLSDDVKPISTKGVLSTGLYGGFLQTKEGASLKENRKKVSWFGLNEYLDTNLKTTAKDYSIRLVRSLPSARAILVIDVGADTVKGILSKLEFDKSGYLAVISPDGREVTATDSKDNDGTKEVKTDAIFTGEKFYQKAITSKNNEGSEYVNYKGETYLFLYTKVGDTGSMICALMPKNTITSQADNIKKVTIIIVIIAIIIATVIAIMISQGIDRAIKGIILHLKDAAKGDLTIKFDSKRKDEFQQLIEEIQKTFSNMRNLIQHVNGLSMEVSCSSENVTKTTQEFLSSTKDISTAMSEIEQGISQQAKDAEECLTQMDNLSKKIVLVSDNTKEISLIADKTKSSISEGTITTRELNNQTQSTIEITTDIIKDIEKLDEKSVSITKIVNVINEIANQTNLLSLNASIEAARAGEYGKGFAVVASEIRKLAEQSQGSVNDIKKIVESLQGDTKKVVVTARKAENVLNLQGNAVKNTTDSYQIINESVEKLVVYLNYITQNVGNIEEARVSTLGAIENISAVLEEIAASTNTVNQTANNQHVSVETLNKEAGTLNNNSDTLVQEVNKFKVD